jgi:hypothetical protein
MFIFYVPDTVLRTEETKQNKKSKLDIALPFKELTVRLMFILMELIYKLMIIKSHTV